MRIFDHRDPELGSFGKHQRERWHHTHNSIKFVSEPHLARWQPDLEGEASEVFGSVNADHPAVDYLLTRSNPVYLGGTVEAIQTCRSWSFVSPFSL